MADSKLAALEATAAARFTSTLARIRSHTKLIRPLAVTPGSLFAAAHVSAPTER